MSVDKYKKIVSGEAWRVNAGLNNILVDMAQQHEATRSLSQQGIGIVSDASVRILNMSGALLSSFGIVGMGEPITPPAVDLDDFRSRKGFESTAPAVDQPFAIVQESIERDTIGSALAIGLTQCLVDMAGAADGFAEVVAGDYAKLASTGAATTCQIRWRDTVPALAREANVRLHSDTVAPVAGDGENGDYWEDTSAELWYGPKAAGAWPAGEAFGTGVVWACVLLAGAGAAGTDSIIAHTASSFVIPAVGASVAVTVTDEVDTSVWMVIGQTILLTDGARVVYGHITVIADSTTFTLMTDRVASGAAGQTMTIGADVIVSGDPDPACDCCIAGDEIAGIFTYRFPDTLTTTGPGASLILPKCISTDVVIEVWGRGGSVIGNYFGSLTTGGCGGGAYAKTTVTLPGQTQLTIIDGNWAGEYPDYANVMAITGMGLGVLAKAANGERVLQDQFANAPAGAGGLASNCIGDVKYSGGNGASAGGHGNGGGGGGAGPNGAGSAAVLGSGGFGWARGGDGGDIIFDAGGDVEHQPGGGSGGTHQNNFLNVSSHGGYGLVRITWGPGVTAVNGLTGSVTMVPVTGTGIGIPITPPISLGPNNGVLAVTGPLVNDLLQTDNGGFGADVSDYNGLPVFANGVAGDLDNTRGSGDNLEVKLGTNSWLAFSEESF